MMATIIYFTRYQEPDIHPFFIWSFILILCTLIGLLSSGPPESINHTFIENKQKTQFITIGATSTSSTTEQ